MKKFILIICVLIFSCKGESNSSQTEEVKVEIDPYLTVSIKAIILEDDRFDLYYSEDVISQYHPDDKIQLNIKGKAEAQDLVFELPEKTYPIKLRIDIGSKNHETPVEISEIILSTGANAKTFSNEELNAFFKPNKYIEISTATTNTYNRKIVDGVYDPFFVSTNIYDLIISLFKEDYAK